MKIFATSDSHFWHERIITLCKRPFSSVEIMNECLIENWNAKVSPDDLVIHCGDFALCSAERFDEVIKRLRGRKILVKGNHDSRSIMFYLDHGFSFVCNYFSLKNILFTHKPLSYIEVCDSKFTEALNVHGHIHNNIETVEYGISSQKRINVSVEVTDYFPVSLDEILFRKEEE